MAGRTTRDALAQFTESARASLLCVTDEHVRFGGMPTARDEAIALNQNTPVELNGGVVPLALRVTFRYGLIDQLHAPARERWRLVVSGYAYALEEPETEREYLAFHWHSGVDAIDFPHLHIASSLLSDQARRGFAKMHVPTGLLALADVLVLAIRDLGVEPQRAGWQAVLAAGRERALAAFDPSPASRVT